MRYPFTRKLLARAALVVTSVSAAACTLLTGADDFAIVGESSSREVSSEDGSAPENERPVPGKDGSVGEVRDGSLGDAPSVKPDSALPESGVVDSGADRTTNPRPGTVWPTNGHSYLLVVAAAGIDWPSADLAARLAGGHLVTLTSSAENDFVYGLFSSRNDVWNDRGGPWTGGYQRANSTEPSGGWTWVTSEAWNYSFWNSGQPNNLDDREDRVIYGVEKSSWNDTASNNLQPAYIVEFE